MKMQLPPPNNFSIAKNPSAFSAPPQRQGLDFAPCARRLITGIYEKSGSTRGASPGSPVVENYFPEIIRQIQEHKDGLTAFADFSTGSPSIVVNIPTIDGQKKYAIALNPQNLVEGLDLLRGQLPEMKSLKDKYLSNLPAATVDIENYLFSQN